MTGSSGEVIRMSGELTLIEVDVVWIESRLCFEEDIYQVGMLGVFGMCLFFCDIQ